MQLRAIADVAPLVTMTTKAILSKAPTHCGHHFSEVSLQYVELSLRNIKLKLE
jgi:hypothetical protein